MRSKTRLKTEKTKCPMCGRRLTVTTPKPLSLDSRFRRGMTTIITTLRLITEKRGRGAAKAEWNKLEGEVKSALRPRSDKPRHMPKGDL